MQYLLDWHSENAKEFIDTPVIKYSIVSITTQVVGLNLFAN